MLAVRTGAPVVPAYVAGTGEAWPPGAWWLRSRPITVVFGEPMYWRAEATTTDETVAKRRYQQVSQEIMGRIAELQQEAHTRRLRLDASTVAR
jgi:1-acyl-sn-glycerol-3-phosphate acyltransferase